MTKVCCIIYHKNAFQIYKPEWIDMCINSILKQTHQNFDIFELNYDNQEESVFKVRPERHTFLKKKCINFIEGMNFLLDKIFNELNYDCCFNVNLDDYYALNRFERQLMYINAGFDLISSNLSYVNEDSNIVENKKFHHLNIRKQLIENHNIIAHPVVCYSKKFWQGCGKYDPKEIRHEDLLLWKRTINSEQKFRFHIINEYLLFHRIHENKVSTSNNS